MTQALRDFCLSAIAYLKVQEPQSDEVAIELSESESPVIRSLGHRLLVTYVVDEGESFTYVQHRHLSEAVVTTDELHAAAVRNLAALAAERVEVRAYGSIYAVIMGGNFEASLLLVEEFWEEWGSLAPNGFVAAFPARDILAFGNAFSTAVIDELNGMCQRCNTVGVDHPLTDTLYCRVGSSWLPLDVKRQVAL